MGIVLGREKPDRPNTLYEWCKRGKFRYAIPTEAPATEVRLLLVLFLQVRQWFITYIVSITLICQFENVLTTSISDGSDNPSNLLTLADPGTCTPAHLRVCFSNSRHLRQTLKLSPNLLHPAHLQHPQSQPHTTGHNTTQQPCRLHHCGPSPAPALSQAPSPASPSTTNRQPRYPPSPAHPAPSQQPPTSPPKPSPQPASPPGSSLLTPTATACSTSNPTRASTPPLASASATSSPRDTTKPVARGSPTSASRTFTSARSTPPSRRS